MVVQSLEAADSRCELGVPRGGSDGMLLSGVTELAGVSSAILDTLEVVTDGNGGTSGLRSDC